MKKNGLVLIIGFIVILLCGILGVLWLKFGNNKIDKDNIVNNNSGEKKYGVISKTFVKGVNLYPQRVNGNYYIVDEGGKCGVVDSNNKNVIPFLYEACDFSGDVLIAEKDNKSYALGMSNEVLFEVDGRLNFDRNMYDDTLYYFIIENGKTLVYDDNFKLLKTIDEVGYFSFFDKYIIADEYVYRFDNDEKIKFNSFDFYGDYIVFEVNKGYDVYNAKSKELIHYEKREKRDYIISFSNGNEKLIIDKSGNVLEEKKLKLLDKYYLDFVCEEGFNLTDLDGKKLSDNCYISYFEELLEYGVLLLQRENYAGFDLVTLNGEIVSFNNHEIYISGGNISILDGGREEYYYYDINGNKHDEACIHGMSKISNNRYVCNAPIAQYIVDEERNPISGPYDSLFCNESGVCVVEDSSNKYGVLFNDEIIVEPTFINGFIHDDIVVLVDGVGNYVLEFGKSDKLLTKEDLVFEERLILEDINIDEVIKEYSLENIETIIKDNEELFKRYASVVFNNGGIADYKKEVLSMFNVIVDQKKNLDEEYFFSGLNALTMKKVDEMWNINYSGVYVDENKSIEFIANDYSLITHELMHFFDYNINKHNLVYLCDGEYRSLDDISKISLFEQRKCEIFNRGLQNDFIVEAGAEVNSFRYTGAVLDSYPDSTVIYHALVYLYGEEFMESVYFSRDGDYQLLKKITNYISYDEYMEFMDAAVRTSDADAIEYDINNTKIIAETLIKLYEKTNGSKWYEDKEFVFIISFLVNGYDMNIYDFETEYLYNRDTILGDILKEYFGKYSVRSAVSGIVMSDGKIYLNIPTWNNGKVGIVKLIYDFETEKVLELIGFYQVDY